MTLIIKTPSEFLLGGPPFNINKEEGIITLYNNYLLTKTPDPRSRGQGLAGGFESLGSMYLWVVVEIMVPFWVLITIRHLIFRGPKRGP